MTGITYLDHAGATPPAKALLEAFSTQMTSNLLSNPHSASPSSQFTTQRIEDIRLRVLQFFKANPEDFDLIFVANATAGIKVVMDAFREQEEGFWYGYHKDAHTSLVGVREAAKLGHHCFMSDAEVEAWLQARDSGSAFWCQDEIALFAYPSQSNMDGRRLPLSWTGCVRSSRNSGKTYTLLDAAALVSTSPLDLSDSPQAPDFTVLSFNKIFGFPDLGALIVRKDSSAVLQQRSYFGGGTVEMVTCGKENWHIRKQGSMHEQLEDGTLPFHSIVALGCALDVHTKLFGPMQHVASHTIFLIQRLYQDLAALRHHNGTKVCEIYKDPSSSYCNGKTQGPIIAFNLRNSHGSFISNSEVEKLANIRSIHIRSGGLCNPGGIASSLGLAPWEMKRNFSAGQRCGGDNDIIEGKPTGALRVSLGAMSNIQDISTFVEFIKEFFVEDSPVIEAAEDLHPRDSAFYVESLMIYPIKSCGGWAVPIDMSWTIKDEGLSWDREWCIVHLGTRAALSQKRYPIMSLLKPKIDLFNGLLRVGYLGSRPPGVPSEITVPLSEDPTVFTNRAATSVPSTSEVCGDDIAAQLYASPTITDFFTQLIGTSCTLARFQPATSGFSTRHTKAHLNLRSNPRVKHPILLSNESPILIISRSSINRLNEQIKERMSGAKAAHASVFRANMVLAEQLPHSGKERPYVEDDWTALDVGDGGKLRLDLLGGCRRCQMLCVDQMTAEKDEEPFVTLTKTRRKQGRTYFGVHAALVKDVSNKQAAKIRIGDAVRPFVPSEG